MSVEMQRQEPMVSSNRSRENDYDSVTTKLTKIAVLRRGDAERPDADEAGEYQC